MWVQYLHAPSDLDAPEWLIRELTLFSCRMVKNTVKGVHWNTFPGTAPRALFGGRLIARPVRVKCFMNPKRIFLNELTLELKLLI